ncbi:hypothetical protein HDU98_005344, partial [Podochytrium sp. JEL0797]
METPAPLPPLALSSQSVALRVDFAARVVQGVASLALAAASQAAVPHVVRLHCRQAVVRAATVNGIKTTFTHNDPFVKINAALAEKQTDPHNHQEFRALYLKSLQQTETEPELEVAVPAELRRQSLSLTQKSDSLSVSPVPTAPQPDSSFIAITIQIEYELIDPKIGIHFVFPEPGLSTAVEWQPLIFYPRLESGAKRLPFVIIIRCGDLRNMSN